MSCSTTGWNSLSDSSSTSPTANPIRHAALPSPMSLLLRSKAGAEVGGTGGWATRPSGADCQAELHAYFAASLWPTVVHKIITATSSAVLKPAHHGRHHKWLCRLEAEGGLGRSGRLPGKRYCTAACAQESSGSQIGRQQRNGVAARQIWRVGPSLDREQAISVLRAKASVYKCPSTR